MHITQSSSTISWTKILLKSRSTSQFLRLWWCACQASSSHSYSTSHSFNLRTIFRIGPQMKDTQEKLRSEREARMAPELLLLLYRLILAAYSAQLPPWSAKMSFMTMLMLKTSQIKSARAFSIALSCVSARKYHLRRKFTTWCLARNQTNFWLLQIR